MSCVSHSTFKMKLALLLFLCGLVASQDPEEIVDPSPDDLAAEEDDTASQLSTNLYNPSNLIFPADEVNWEGEEVLDTKPEEINDVIGFDEGGEVYASPNREKRSLPTSSSRQRRDVRAIAGFARDAFTPVIQDKVRGLISRRNNRRRQNQNFRPRPGGRGNRGRRPNRRGGGRRGGRRRG